MFTGTLPQSREGPDSISPTSVCIFPPSFSLLRLSQHKSRLTDAPNPQRVDALWRTGDVLFYLFKEELRGGTSAVVPAHRPGRKRTFQLKVQQTFHRSFNFMQGPVVFSERRQPENVNNTRCCLLMSGLFVNSLSVETR